MSRGDALYQSYKNYPVAAVIQLSLLSFRCSGHYLAVTTHLAVAVVIQPLILSSSCSCRNPAVTTHLAVAAVIQPYYCHPAVAVFIQPSRLIQL